MSQLVAPTFEPDLALISRLDFLTEVRSLCAKGSWRDGAHKLSAALGSPETLSTETQAEQYLERYFYSLIDQREMILASALAWDRGMFEPRPVHIQRIFAALNNYDKNILIGAAGLGKTFGASAWATLQWLGDPDYTSVKVASISDTNLRGNLWSKIWVLNEATIFPVARVISEQKMTIRKEKGSPDSGFQAVLLSQAREARGKIKGLHPNPFRSSPHPTYGNLTQVHIVIDEAQHVPPGIKADLGSPLGSISSNRAMKVTLSANPVDEQLWALKAAEPRQGWREDLMDKLYDWESLDGWHVTRVDVDVTENVRQKRIVFPGFPDPDSEKQYMTTSGDATAAHSVMYRGWPPQGRAKDVVVPSSWFEAALAEPIYTGQVWGIITCDPAFTHDKAVVALTRYGLATGYIDRDGHESTFVSRKITGEVESRHCMVVDQIVHLSAKESVEMGVEIKKWAEDQRIPPEFCGVDIGGPGHGVISWLRTNWGPVVEINYRAGASEMKIMADDRYPAINQVTDIVSEMYWTIRRWIEPSRVHGFFIRPGCEHLGALKKQLTSRLHDNFRAGQLVKVEDKRDYLKHEDSSPDEADAVAQATYVVRVRALPLPALSDESATRLKNLGIGQRGSSGPAPETADISSGLQGAPTGGGPVELLRWPGDPIA